MCTTAVGTPLADPQDPVAVVLQSERDALADVERFTRRMRQLVLTSSLHAVLIQKRTERRIERLRERMTADANRRRTRIQTDIEAAEADPGRDILPGGVLDEAIAAVAAELAGMPASS